MSTDRQRKRAMENGQRNADGFILVRNWCSHLRIERSGGVGLVEQATGLPIGHHGLSCDPATAGGMMSWEIKDAALDFYERNCKNCKQRMPVGLPNLGSWVAERDAQVAKRRLEEQAYERKAATALARRQAERAALRSDLPPAAANVIEQVDDLDLQRTAELTSRLAETARLAPDAFPPPVVEFFLACSKPTNDGSTKPASRC